ncbi:xylose repressor [Alicyclobacillus contaminans]|uniref:ROK family transcriptional regulator n=1 Tax=Alicyclobacillus contaminans TaxID=392016 RepID=UPI00041E0793|nr:ROK family transcriptional regulator [Alicyclobacillus contaminans]GMA50797.1 xylose repressor [Alicyclobacillus contaminans]
MTKRIDASTMRQWNKATVLHCIRSQSPISRIQLAEVTGLNKATISSLVDELLTEQYIVEVGFGDSNGGRKPILLEFNANAAFTVGIDVQISHVTTTLCNALEQVVWEHTVDMTVPGTEVKNMLLELLTLEAKRAIAAAPASPHGVLGVGIALPGMVSFENGYVYMLPNLGVTEWDVRTPLQARLQLPVFIDNDANCGAWASYRLHPEYQNLIYVSAGIGVGAGLVMEGKLYRGSRGVAGEFGHTTIVAMGIRCSCGNYGCWERYAAQDSLYRYLLENGVTEFSEGERDFVARVVQEANRGRRECARALTTLGQFLGVGVANIANTLNPDAIFLGGQLIQAESWLLPQLRVAMQIKSVEAVRHTPIHLAKVDSMAVGAAGIALSETLYPIRMGSDTPGTVGSTLRHR